MKDYAPRLLCGGVGIVLLVLAFVQPDEKGELALGSLGAGVLLLLAAIALPRIRKVSLPGGASLELDPVKDRTTALASGESVATGHPGSDDAEEILNLANALLYDLFHPKSGPLVGCEFHLHLLDPTTNRLMPVFGSSPSLVPEGWEIGQGATGAAWRDASFVLAEGEDVASNDVYGLTPSQRARCRGLAIVAAMPVLSPTGTRVLGVLTGTTDDPSSGLREPEGFEYLLYVATAVSEVLTDQLKWFTNE